MGVTLISQPAETVAAANCPIYSLELDSPGADPLVYSLGYELYVDGEKLAGLEQIPYTGAAEPFSPAEILKAKVRSTLLGYNTTTPTWDSAAVKPFYLKYGQIEYNKDSCAKLTALGNQSPTRYAVNSVFPWYIDPAVIDSGAPVVLTQRPARVLIYSGQRDWLHIWRKSGIVGVRFRGYDGSGTLVSEQGSNGSFNRQVRIFPIGPGNGFFTWDPAISYYDIEVFDSAVNVPDITALEGTDIGSFDLAIQALVWSCRFVVGQCENLTPPNDEIYFEEPLGGYSGIKFLEVQGRTTVSSQQYIAGAPCGVAFPGYGQSYGRTRFGAESYTGAQMRTEIPYETGIDKWLETFFSARNHYRKFRLADGSYTYEKVILVDGSYNTLNNRETVVLEATFDSHLSRI